MTNTAIHDKLRKLMAMADHPNTNPNEAANAAAMAARLAAAHNIELDSVSAKTDKIFHRHYMNEKMPLRDEQAMYALVDAVAKTYGCIGRLLVYRGAGVKPVFIGQPHNTSLAASWFKYLWDTCKRANREHARSMNYGSTSAREDARSAFRYAFCSTVATRLFDVLNETKAQTTTTSNGNALVVGAWFEQEAKDVQQWLSDEAARTAAKYPVVPVGPNAAPVKVRAYRGRTIKGVVNHRDALNAGADAGRRASLNTQIKG